MKDYKDEYRVSAGLTLLLGGCITLVQSVYFSKSSLLVCKTRVSISVIFHLIKLLPGFSKFVHVILWHKMSAQRKKSVMVVSIINFLLIPEKTEVILSIKWMQQ